MADLPIMNVFLTLGLGLAAVVVTVVAITLLEATPVRSRAGDRDENHED